MITIANPRPVGDMLREWRTRRSLSQLDLALEAGVSARHLSFVETGRAQPSRDMVLNLAAELGVPLRERNELLLAAGFAPVYRESRLDEPELAGIRAALERLLMAHEPYPAIVLDGQRNIVAANRGLAVLTEGVAAHLLESPANSLRIALHPEGMASRIVNFDEVSFYTLEGLSRSIAGTGDEGLKALYRELASYPNVALERPPASLDAVSALALPIRLRRGNGELAFYSSFTTFNTPRNVGLAELSLEAFYPANEETGRILRPC